jgi:hypothetical protein
LREHASAVYATHVSQEVARLEVLQARVLPVAFHNPEGGPNLKAVEQSLGASPFSSAWAPTLIRATVCEPTFEQRMTTPGTRESRLTVADYLGADPSDATALARLIHFWTGPDSPARWASNGPRIPHGRTVWWTSRTGADTFPGT